MKKTSGLLNHRWHGLRGVMASVILWPSIFVGAFLGPPNASAQMVTPTYASGASATTEDSPCVPFQVGPDTGTVALLAISSGVSAGNPTATQGFIAGAASQAQYTPAYLSWVLLSTGTIGPLQFVLLSDTGTIDTLTNRVDSQAGIGGGVNGVYASTGAVLWNMSLYASSTTVSSFYQFHPPIRLRNGLRVQLASNTITATVCTRSYGIQQP